MPLTSFDDPPGTSAVDTVTTFVSSIFPVAHTEEEEEEEEEEEDQEDQEDDDDDDDESADPRDEIFAGCQDRECGPAKHQFEECQTRVESGKLLFDGEDCIEEL